jgi:hypothetical protein
VVVATGIFEILVGVDYRSTQVLVVMPAARFQAPGLKFGRSGPRASQAIPKTGGLSWFLRSRNVPDINRVPARVTAFGSKSGSKRS